MDDWRLIETAPLDGTWFLATCEGINPDTGEPFIPVVVQGSKAGWREPHDEVPWSPDEWKLTHWTPCPAPITTPEASS